MSLCLGCDIVHLPRLAERIRLGGEKFLAEIFLPHESEGASLERLAGTFAAKEAAMKAFRIPAGNWLAISLVRGADGAPKMKIDYPAIMVEEVCVSISHDGEYAFAVVAV